MHRKTQRDEEYNTQKEKMSSINDNSKMGRGRNRRDVNKVIHILLAVLLLQLLVVCDGTSSAAGGQWLPFLTNTKNNNNNHNTILQLIFDAEDLLSHLERPSPPSRRVDEDDDTSIPLEEEEKWGEFGQDPFPTTTTTTTTTTTATFRGGGRFGEDKDDDAVVVSVVPSKSNSPSTISGLEENETTTATTTTTTTRVTSCSKEVYTSDDFFSTIVDDETNETLAITGTTAEFIISTSFEESYQYTFHEAELEEENTLVGMNQMDDFEEKVVEEETFSSTSNEDRGERMISDNVPYRYLKTYQFNVLKAKEAWNATIRWRDEFGTNKMLETPYRQYDLLKRVFPMHFLGYDQPTKEHVVLIQKPGQIDFALAKLNHLTSDDILYYYVYMNEYLWQILDTNQQQDSYSSTSVVGSDDNDSENEYEDHPIITEKKNSWNVSHQYSNSTMTSIIDLEGLSVSTIWREKQLLDVAIQFCITMESHYPARSYQTFLINTPKWFASVYKMISPLLRESTKSKVMILTKGSKEQDVKLAALLESGGDGDDNNEQLSSYESTSMEQDLRSFVSYFFDKKITYKTS